MSNNNYIAIQLSFLSYILFVLHALRLLSATTSSSGTNASPLVPALNVLVPSVILFCLMYTIIKPLFFAISIALLTLPIISL